MENQQKTEAEIIQRMNEISLLFQNPVITLIVRADNIPGGSFIITRDDVTNTINILREFRSAKHGQIMPIETLVELHKDLGTLELFIGAILPENISPEKLQSIRVVQEIIEVMIKVMKKNAIQHQFQ